MISDLIFKFLGNCFMGLFSIFSIPAIPGHLLQSAYNFLDVLFENAALLGLFIRISTIKWVAFLLIIIYNWERILRFVTKLVGSILISKNLPFIKN